MLKVKSDSKKIWPYSRGLGGEPEPVICYYLITFFVGSDGQVASVLKKKARKQPSVMTIMWNKSTGKEYYKRPVQKAGSEGRLAGSRDGCSKGRPDQKKGRFVSSTLRSLV